MGIGSDDLSRCDEHRESGPLNRPAGRRGKRLIGGVAVVLALAIAVGCGSDDSSSDSRGEGSSNSAQSTGANQELYEAAKEEGELLMYTGRPTEAVEVMAERFNETYPGIEVKSVSGSGEDTIQRLHAESAAGNVRADIIESTSPDFYLATNNDLVAKCDVPNEYGDEQYEDPEGLWNIAMILVDFTAYNTQEYGPDEVPQTFDDYADPKFKGKLLTADSTSPWQALRYEKFDGDLEATKEYFQKLADNELQIFDGQPRQVAELMASGQRPIFAWANDFDIEGLKELGAPVEKLSTEAIVTLYLAGCAEGAPHPNAARLFVEWMLTKEGQEAQIETGFSSIHPEVENSPIDISELDTAYYVRPEYADSSDEDLAAYNQIFGLD